jgi:hypothetical protein
MATEGELDVWKLGAEAWPAASEPDVYVFDGWLPPGERWPSGVPAVAINPPGSSGPVRAVPVREGGIPHPAVRPSGSDHPVLFRVPSGRVAVTQTAVIDATGSLEPLWFAGREPLLAAGEAGGQRLVVMAFAPQRSEQLPLMAAYPVLLANSVYWCAEQSSAADRPRDYETGTVIAAGGGSLRWWEPVAPGRPLREVTSPLAGSFAELDRVGLWETADGRSGSAVLVSRHESDLGDGSAGTLTDQPDGPAAGPPALLRGELTPWLLAFAVALLLLESWLFHRHGVY